MSGTNSETTCKPLDNGRDCVEGRGLHGDVSNFASFFGDKNLQVEGHKAFRRLKQVLLLKLDGLKLLDHLEQRLFLGAERLVLQGTPQRPNVQNHDQD